MTEPHGSFRIGVDIGGTFTDVIGRRGDRVLAAKVPSSPEDLAAGVLTGVDAVLALSGEAPEDVDRFVHGTTIATNAILDEKGARIGLLMTEGFEDVLEIGRQKRYDGGTHLPDLVVAVPVFAAGRTVSFAVCLAHQEDFGGKVPGSMPTDATEIFQEGLILPPLKIYDAGVLNETLVGIIRRNVRLPRVVMGDISAQVAAATVGRDRLQALFEEYGTATDACLDGLLDYAERLTRARISEIPDGMYRFTDYMDNDGIALDRRVPITATVRIEGETVTVDFTGTSSQVAGPINAPWSGGAGSAYFAVRCVTDPSIPNNQGCYRPIDVVIPEGTLLNPHHPAPVAIRAHTLKRAADVVLGALVQAVPDRVPAAPAGSISCVSFGGVDPRSGERFGLSDIVAGGSGGRPGGDGIEVVDTDVSNCMNIPVEAIEMDYPLRVRSYRLRRDSGGARSTAWCWTSRRERSTRRRRQG